MIRFLRNLALLFKCELSQMHYEHETQSKKNTRLVEEAIELECHVLHRVEELKDLLDNVIKPPPKKYLVLKVKDIEITTSGDFKMAFQLKDTQEVVLSAAVVDAKGNPAALVNAPVWSVADSTVVSVVASADGLSAVVTAGTTFATTTVTFEVDGITATFDITLVGGAAATATITAGTPTDIPVVAPVEPAPVEPSPVDPNAPAV